MNRATANTHVPAAADRVVHASAKGEAMRETKSPQIEDKTPRRLTVATSNLVGRGGILSTGLAAVGSGFLTPALSCSTISLAVGNSDITGFSAFGVVSDAAFVSVGAVGFDWPLAAASISAVVFGAGLAAPDWARAAARISAVLFGAAAGVFGVSTSTGAGAGDSAVGGTGVEDEG